MSIYPKKTCLVLLLAVALPLQQACIFTVNANTTLVDIERATNDAGIVLSAVEGALCPAGSLPAAPTICISVTVEAQINSWLTGLQSANTAALAIDAGAKTLTASQIAKIAELYANVVLANVPLPPQVALVVAAAQAAIQILLELFQTAQASMAAHPPTPHNFVGRAVRYPLHKSAQAMNVVYDETLHGLAQYHNDRLGERIGALHSAR